MLKKNDFIELEFTSFVQGTNEVFDTTRVDDAKKAGLTQNKKEEEFKPLRICIGHGMVIAGLDNALVGKEPGKEYEIVLQPNDAFGIRNPKLLRIMSQNSFRKNGIDPVPGMTLALDNLLVRISSVSGGRVTVDFNNPLSGKIVVYKVKINKVFESPKEKLEILSVFFFGGSESVSVEGNKASLVIPFELPKELIGMYAAKIKEILGLDASIAAKQAVPEQKEKEAAA